MKRITSYLVCTFLALALIGTLTTCVPELEDPRGGYADNGRLSISATVSDATVVTKAESVGALKEKDLNTLDIFVEHVTGTNGDGTFILQYHLPLSQFPSSVPAEARVIGDQVKSFLAERWSQEGLVFGEKYNIYVAANNTQTKGTKDLSTFNVAALKALVANEKEENIAVLDSDGNIGWKDGKTSGNIYKLYDANPGDARALSSEKEFMMDGVLKNWTPVAGSKDQVFGFTKTDDNIQSNPNQALILNRAAAKFVLNVKFDADFLKTLTQTKKIVNGVETWVDKPDEEKITITGSPAWKFYNFAFGAPVFTPETQGAGVELHNSGFNIFHNQSYTGDDKHFTITTYSYPNKWAEADYSTKAPSLVVSVGFTQNGVTNYHYYRIPLVKSTVTEIERNHIYVINATIATKGSTVQEDVTVTEDINYAVLPWNDQTNSDVIENNVESVQHYYFRVNPKVYTLRGDGDQSVVLNYSKASGTKVNWKVFTYDDNGNQTAVVANNDTNGEWAWFYNSSGAFITEYSDRVNSQNRNWDHMGVTISQSEEGTSGSKGTITVTSTALTNKAIKYIRLRVYLDEVVDGESLEEAYHEDIIIRHFPTDNIQSIDGHWSSYHPTGSSSSQPVTLTTKILSEAQSWAEQYGVDYTAEEKTNSENINYTTYAAHSTEEGYSAIVVPGVTVDEMYDATGGNNWNSKIQNANSQANAFLSDGWYYWGENPQRVTQGEYDYYTGNGNNRRYYLYTTRYRAQYTHTTSYTLYSITVPMASTGSWVDWSNRDSHSPARTYEINYGNAQYNYYGQFLGYEGSFIAKVMQSGTMYYITEERSGNSYTTETGSSTTSLTNNHMYVIQISSTSDEYVLGRPYVDQSTHQSQDNVVSPAFMIASQLGAVQPFMGNNGPANAAIHCSQYMEVAEDGTRYTEWRLPTKAEISVITGYQYGNIGGVTVPQDYRVLSPVLTGRYYHSLSGQEVEANPNADQQSQTKSYLRCVRDLSAEEVERLNGFDKIQEKYR